MRRGLLFCLAAAVLLVAGSASAEMYTSLRMTGTGNYALGMMSGFDLMDTGFFNYHEFAVGFGEEFQGEVSVGFSRMTGKYEEEVDDETIEHEDVLSWYTLGAAGFYGLAEGKTYRMDIGARFQYHNAKWEATAKNGTTDESSASMSGWSIGPVIRYQWFLGGGGVAIGPEIYPKYTSLSSETKYTPEEARQSTITEEGPEVTGWNIDYSLRLDFYF